MAQIIARACDDARKLADAGFDAVEIENFGDAPFRPGTVDPHTVACMTVVTQAVRDAVSIPVGVNVLRNDALASLAIATTCQASFIRVNVHAGVYATDQGIIEGRADETLRYRQQLGSNVAIFADVHVKHAQSLMQDSITDAAKEVAYRSQADGLIVSGKATGQLTGIEDLKAVCAAVPDRPIYVGSGATPETAKELLTAAHGIIVGTAIKQDGITINPVDPNRAAAFVKATK